MYQIGMKVVHPLHGLGEVESLEEKTILGSTTRFAGISFQDGRLNVMINVSSKNPQVRALVAVEEVEKVMAHLRNNVCEVPPKANDRHTFHLTKLKKGDIYSLCEVVKDTIHISSSKKISPREHSLLKQARGILADELSCVTGCDRDEMEKIIDHTCRVRKVEMAVA